jgi:hypothetical protein
MAAVRALAAVDFLMLIVRVDDHALFFRGRELPRGRLLVIDPHDGMKIRHTFSLG